MAAPNDKPTLGITEWGKEGWLQEGPYFLLSRR
jgi:hypothetical protein